MSDEIDPEIAALLGGAVEEYKPTKKGSASSRAKTPSYEHLFGDMTVTGDVAIKGEFEVDLSKKAFKPVTAFEADPPNEFFNDPQYYAKAMSGEGEESQRFHDVLKKYLQATDPKDRGVYRQQVVVTYWNLATRLAPRVIGRNVLPAKQVMFRYGISLPTMMGSDQRDVFHRIIHVKKTDEPVYYIDEWLKNIALGRIQSSSTDEVKTTRTDERTRFNNLLQKAQGKREAAEAVLKAKADERRTFENLLKERIDSMTEHSSMPGFLHIPAPYTEAQKKASGEFYEVIKRMMAADRELIAGVENFEEATKEVNSLRDKMGAMGAEEKADIQALNQEFETLRQMIKMCVGRQGNHFPLISKEYFHSPLREVGTRENVIDALGWIESVDCQAYGRPYKNTLNRIEPFVILLPCYGDKGICWEPFDRFNRHTSRARVAIPMYPKNLRQAVIYGVGDMRWQSAKEKASYYWMEEGLTGQYYQWFTKQKIKGDVKEYFAEDYLTWITKESEGIQKLDKEIRGIFWRLIPFSQPIKEKLRERSFVYQELYQKDINRSLSDGY